MTKKSAGILLYRKLNKTLEVFLVHPGGPFYSRKDLGTWSIPKGEYTDEDPELAARREFFEETGSMLAGELMYLAETKMKSGKLISCWAVEGDFDEKNLISNTFELEWPPRSGKMSAFPEVDKGAWFNIEDAKEKIHPSQLVFLDALVTFFGSSGS
ncbi:NUDIX domain-containing protein [Dyadobacter sp. CY326]|uniref:NUDIX domain-containing protein n=1 Tax=Dyadobacter sp. CY326 TaxID=2907300 RepID=UPI001F49137E|nr:NUDIX domain-containing protein [Dyadobacter sp. CY326]MCE7066171.1 NUDIX domain-containing protein [Dyadobacter sp. CY326]